MAPIPRRQPAVSTASAAATKPSSNGNGNINNGHHHHHHNQSRESGSRRKTVMSFFCGAGCMGALMFYFRDVALLCPRIIPGGKTVLQPSAFQQQNRDLIAAKNRSISITTNARRGRVGKKKSFSSSSTTTAATTTVEQSDWQWFEGDVNKFYNELEKDHNRDPTNPSNYAVHRWMGSDHSTTHHYQLLYESILRYTGTTSPTGMKQLRVFDAGCGLGSTMKWLEERQPSWQIVGHTLSEEQIQFIQTKLPPHKFTVELKSFDDLSSSSTTANKYDVIYSIEAMIHSVNVLKTLQAWSKHLHDKHGSLVIIDDFLMPGADKNTQEMQLFQKGWMANSLYAVAELNAMARQCCGMELVESRDLLAEFRVVELNYRNKVPSLAVDGTKSHQGWMGSKLRHKLTVEGKLGYNMVVFRKTGAKKPHYTPTTTSVKDDEADCAVVPVAGEQDDKQVSNITPKKECISSWYCCDKHEEYLHKLATNRTNRHGFLLMDERLFGNYMEAFAKHLNEFYETIPADYTSGRFLDIGATGSTASGMQQVTSKFAHFVGPLEYWMLDSDEGAQSLPRTIYCDICDCPQGESCGFDVTFSHTVLEHAARPEKAFDTIARLTKKGGLTLHLVPWSYQYHATPDDYYRFSHSALRVLMEDRGFEPLEIGYDLCSKPGAVMNRVDEHYDFIWLTYVIAKKL